MDDLHQIEHDLWGDPPDEPDRTCCDQAGYEHMGLDPAAAPALYDALAYAVSIVCNVENPTVTQDIPWEPLRQRFLDQANAALSAARLPGEEELPPTPPPAQADCVPNQHALAGPWDDGTVCQCGEMVLRQGAMIVLSEEA